MVQDVVIAAYRWLLNLASYLWQLLPILLVTALLTAAIVLLWRRFDPEGATRLSGSFRANSRRTLLIGCLAILTAAFAGALVQSKKVVEVRRTAIREASASRRNDPNLSGVTQYAPTVAIIQERTYTRTMTMPPNFLNRVSVEGVQILAPYLSDPSAEGVTKLVDNFRRSGTDVVFTRELTRKDEVALAADLASVKTDFRSIGADSGRRHFEATFHAEYRFRNPRPEAADMKFVFPLPMGGGTLQGFSLTAGSSTIREPDERGMYAWTGNVPASGQVDVKVEYRVTGAGSYDYVLGSERRRIGDFTFAAHSDRTPKFSREGIFPSSLSSNDAEWKLKDVLTAQSISLVFPRADLDTELLDKTLALLPAILVLFAVGAVLLDTRRSASAIAAVGLALLAVPMLASYLPPTLATVVGAALVVAAGGLMLGSKRGWALSAVSALGVLAFLTSEHGMLFAWILAALALIGFAQGRNRKQPSTG